MGKSQRSGGRGTVYIRRRVPYSGARRKKRLEHAMLNVFVYDILDVAKNYIIYAIEHKTIPVMSSKQLKLSIIRIINLLNLYPISTFK